MPYATTDDGVKLYYEEVGHGHADRVRARVRRRPPLVGNADAPFRPAPSLHHLQRARLSAVRRPREACELFAGPRDRRHPGGDEAPQDRQGACRRPVDGRLRHPAFRPAPRRARAVAGRGRRRLRRGEGPAGAKFRGEVEVVAKSLLRRGHGQAFAEKYAYGPTRVQFENKDPRGFAQFKKELGEHSALGSANTQIGCQGRAAVALRPGRGDAQDDHADPDPDRRRGLAVPGAVGC